MTGWRHHTLVHLLATHGLAGAIEEPFPTDGWSGATFTALKRDERRFVLKRTSLAVDWIARATADTELREAWLAAADTRWWAGLSAPYLGAAADGDGAAILMPDLSAELIAWDRPGGDKAIDAAALGRVLHAVARLHAMPWSLVLESNATRAGIGQPPWCPPRERLLLLARPAARVYAAAGNPVAERFLAGWDAFDRSAPHAARDLIERLSDEPAPLLDALGRCRPSACTATSSSRTWPCCGATTWASSTGS